MSISQKLSCSLLTFVDTRNIKEKKNSDSDMSVIFLLMIVDLISHDEIHNRHTPVSFGLKNSLTNCDIVFHRPYESTDCKKVSIDNDDGILIVASVNEYDSNGIEES